MKENLLESELLFDKFLKVLEREITNKEFWEILEKAQVIDGNHYKKTISIELLKSIIREYEVLGKNEKNSEKILILLPGNPEIVFRLGLESVRNNLELMIGIEDFCLAQNTILIETINKVLKELRIKNKIEFKNLLNDFEIIENSKLVEKTIVIGNSNLYNRLQEKINVKLNPYGIFEVYSDSDEFEELQEMIFEVFNQNEFEVEFFDDLDFEDAIRIINKQGYKFCTILFSNDKEKIKSFKDKINSEYVIVNKNPFKQIKFNLDI